MRSAEFFERFAHEQEIGRDIAETHVSVFYDNGKEVGLWREDRRSTIGAGSVLGTEDAEMARHWYRRPDQKETSGGDGASEQRAGKRQRLRSVTKSSEEPRR
jgi:hypothetical protein